MTDLGPSLSHTGRGYHVITFLVSSLQSPGLVCFDLVLIR